MDSIEMKAPTIEGEGEVFKKSEKQEFDPNIVKSGIADDDSKDGGVLPARSSGSSMMSDSAVSPTGLVGGGPGGQYELSGFTATYNISGTKEMASSDVMTKYPSIDAIKEVISGNTYHHKTPSGEPLECRIERGCPTICVDDIQKLRYIEGTWLRA